MLLKCTMAMVAGILAVAAATPGGAADLPDGYSRPGYSQYPVTSCPYFVNGLPVSFGYGLCYQRELLPTPWGPRWRLVNHCC
jgi:hypothetical protein